MLSLVEMVEEDPVEEHGGSVEKEEQTDEELPFIGFDLVVVLFVAEVAVVEGVHFVDG